MISSLFLFPLCLSWVYKKATDFFLYLFYILHIWKCHFWNCLSLCVYVGIQGLPHKPHETWSDLESLLSIYSRSMAHVQELNHDPELQSYRSFKAKTHKHLCQVISSIRIQGQGISLGTCFCYTFILLPLTGVFRCSSRLPLPNIHFLTCLPGWDLSKIHVLTCQPQDVSSQRSLGNLNFTGFSIQNGRLIPNSFLYWCRCLSYVGVYPRGSLYHKGLYIGAGSAIKWVVGLGPSWIQNSSTDFYCD